ncbi:MAG: cysteine desulfurase [Selenomonadaceae bacterium]|nr:cysteine desulfurase [Selenomonadaceae bacterium]
MIYADNAATTQIDEDALNLMIELQTKYFSNPSSSYKISRPLKKILSESREKIAACINAEPSEIFFTSGGTESNNQAIKNFIFSCLNEKPSIITSAIEHKSVLNSCLAMKNFFGTKIIKLPVNDFGEVNFDDLRKKIAKRRQIISIMLANNEVGMIQPIKKLAEISHERAKIFHTDAVQAVGHIPIDVKNLGVDMLSASAHKFNGPKGTGFLYAEKNLNLFPYLDGGGQESGMRAGTENVPAIAAMALALEKNCREMKENEKKLSTVSKILIDRLKNNNADFIVNGGENRLPGHLSLSFKNFDGEVLMNRLDLKNIYVSTGSACNSKTQIISHVLKALKIPKDYIRGTIRITFGKNNSSEDAENIAKNLLEIFSFNLKKN